MKWFYWVLLFVCVGILGALLVSKLSNATGPSPSGTATEQATRQQELIDDMEPFSPEVQSTTDMLEGTVDY